MQGELVLRTPAQTRSAECLNRMKRNTGTTSKRDDSCSSQSKNFLDASSNVCSSYEPRFNQKAIWIIIFQAWYFWINIYSGKWAQESPVLTQHHSSLQQAMFPTTNKSLERKCTSLTRSKGTQIGVELLVQLFKASNQRLNRPQCGGGICIWNTNPALV